ncbi:hypothetical protein PTSG_11760 [Salpingoeca rosetta]|uniref:ABC transporter domain-containing protein n=1 Tax=Salpingoeca rosetta (strain ATCC 50818 / BSB-021) TaxID=946362 RepID=F2TYE3_SALR5|nr:uncharacterized protein PTSG_11760 [Salpingoeca rosetta]EGD78617.1 hypothetical protein PTSG_11760 [Salpingoeca rosetta]|eukprot:XP_004997575.1 hypothetical protein PTSG_11760 [Salpingoeca rosetta]
MPAGARIGSLWEQTKVLFKKNVLVKRRNRRQTMFEMFFPVYMTAIVCLINLAAEKSNFPAETVHMPEPLAPDMLTITPGGVFGYIAHTQSQHTIVNKTLELLADSAPWLAPQPRAFASENDLVEWYNHNQDSLWAAVVFPDTEPGNTFNYTIRMQSTSSAIDSGVASVPHSDKLYTGLGDCRNNSDCSADLYRQSGFLLLQHSLQHAYHVLNGGDPSIVPRVDVAMMPLPAFSEDANAGIRVSAVILTIMAFSPIIQYLMINVVSEKEKGIKDAFYLMGMKPLAYWMSWLLTYMLVLIVPCLLVTAINVLVGVLQNSNFIAVFIVLYAYSLSVTTLAFVFTPFFSKSKVAGVAGSLSNTLISLVIFGLKNKAVSAATKYGVSLVSPCAAAVALEQMLTLDEEGGFNFNSFTRGQYSVFSAVIMMLIDSVLYLVLAWYLDAVVPGNGPTKSPLFFVHSIKSMLCGTPATRASPLSDEQLVLEGDREDESDVMADHEAVIRIENIGKSYSTKDRPALTNVSLRLYEGQIFGLLGHNGAGKTTLHSIITGLRQPSRGRVLVNGLDLCSDAGQDAMRNAMGVCPQHDVLYEKLTVKEHLEIFSGIKGASRDEATFASLLREIDLSDKADTHTDNLSGGQKRKLSVGIALLGDPQILCLDEPSSGMDPYSRRKLWELLQSKRAGRVTLLTTHYMQEADILADRKAILSHGRVQCVGSSLFLKSRYGVGYHLHVAKDASFDHTAVTELVSTHVQSVVPESSQSSTTEVSYALPHAETRNFGPLFQSLSQQRQALGLRSFGVSMTTLEEVFVRLQRIEDERMAEEEQWKEEEESLALAHHQHHESSAGGGSGIVGGLLDKARSLSINAPQGESHTDTLPLHRNTAHAHTGGSNNNEDDEDDEDEEDDGNNGVNGAGSVRVPLLSSSNSTSGSSRQADTFTSDGDGGGPVGMWSVVLALMVVRAKQSLREWRALFFQVVVPAVLLVVSLTVIAKPTSNTSETQPLFDLSPSQYSDMAGLRVPIVDPSGAFARRLNASSGFADSHASTLVLPANVTLQGDDGYLTQNMRGFACAFDALGGSNDTNVTLFYNTTMVHSPAAYVAQVGNSFLGSIDVQVQAASHPLPPKRQLEWDSTIFYTVLLIGIGLSVVPGGFAINAVKDRESKMQHLLEVSGVSGLAYWLADMLRSLSIFSVSVVFAIIVTVAANVEPLTGPGLPLLIILCIVYMPLTILFAFLASYLFSNAETCQSVFPPLNNFLGFIPFIIVGTVDGLGQSNVALILHYVFCIVLPPYSLSGALYYMFRLHTIASFNPDHPHATAKDYWAIDNNVSPTLLIMVASIVLEVAMLYAINNRRRLSNMCFGSAISDVASDNDAAGAELERLGIKEDDDVVHERERCVAARVATTGDADLLRVQRLSKTFVSGGGLCSSAQLSSFVAVRNSSFGVNRGDVLGLLGPNGAGKTTTIAMITGEEVPSSGDVFVCGQNLQTQKWAAMRHMGFCPQFSAVWDNITTEEHLLFFAKLKGRSAAQAEALKRKQLSLLSIEEHEKKQAKQLSGGTQRKLSVAISLINSPDVCLLDEPSTGLDPQSRRVLWNVIKRRLRSTAAVLTTHSMEEAEALCNKIAIMVKGRLVCFGSPTHLKNTYGSGYTLEIKTRAAATERVHAFVRENLPNAKQEETFSGFLSYQLEITDTDLADVFTLLEKHKTELSISEYALSQSTLEQVFLRFAKLQDIEP